MLTSVPPRANGATHNALPVSPEFPTVPEALRRAGYFTGCVQSTWTLKAKMAKYGLRGQEDGALS